MCRVRSEKGEYIGTTGDDHMSAVDSSVMQLYELKKVTMHPRDRP